MEKRLPEHWHTSPLRDIVVSRKGKRPTVLRKAPFPKSLPYLDIKAIEKNIISKHGDDYSSVIVSEKDLFIVWDGSRSGWVGKGKNGALGSTIMSLTPVLVNQHYLYYFLSSKFEYLNKNTIGVGIPHVDGNIFWNLEIPLPPLKEQNKIAQTLDDFFTQLDYFNKRLAAIPIALKRYRKLLLEKAMTGELTKEWREETRQIDSVENLLKKIKDEKKKLNIKHFSESNTENILKDLPLTWKEVELATINLYVTDGDHQSPSKVDKGIPFIFISNLKEGKVDFTNTKFVSERYFNELKKYRKPKPRDVLYSVVGSYGIPVLITEDKKFCFQRHIALLRPSNFISEYFLYHLMRSQVVYLQATDIAKGVAQQTVPLTGLRQIKIPLPTLEEQQEIVKRVEKLLKKADKIEEYYRSAVIGLEQSSKIVLAKAFNGELVAPEDEEMPVVELLAKIKIEKANIEAQRKTFRKKRSRQPKPPKMTKETLQNIIKEQFPNELFNYEMLSQVLKNEVQYEYEELRNILFELLRPPLKEEDSEAFLKAIFESELKFKIK